MVFDVAVASRPSVSFVLEDGVLVYAASLVVVVVVAPVAALGFSIASQ